MLQEINLIFLRNLILVGGLKKYLTNPVHVCGPVIWSSRPGCYLSQPTSSWSFPLGSNGLHRQNETPVFFQNRKANRRLLLRWSASPSPSPSPPRPRVGSRPSRLPPPPHPILRGGSIVGSSRREKAPTGVEASAAAEVCSLRLSPPSTCSPIHSLVQVCIPLLISQSHTHMCLLLSCESILSDVK
jgi:hypothetical protein